MKFLLTGIWFFLDCFFILLLAPLRWRNPNNGYLFAQILTKGAAAIIGYKIVIHNEERLMASQPCIYIGNHQDNADLVILGSSYRPNTVVIGKKELLWIPFFGILFYACGNILLNRGHHAQAMSKMAQAVDCLKNRKLSIYMFPEGTRNRGAPNLLPFKKGAFYAAVDAGVPLVPVVAAPNSRIVDFRAKKIYHRTAHIQVLEPIPTLGLKEHDVPALIELAHARMQEAFEKLSKKES